jgi:tetratricopeptide (TPR) repeat protein
LGGLRLLDWLDKKKRARGRAERSENRGELSAAVELYLTADAPDEAARVLLLRADAEQNIERRLAHYARAAASSPDGEHGRSASQRSAALRFDVARSAGGLGLDAELRRLAKELEACEHWDKVLEAYRMLGDAAGEIRALEGAGNIDALEEKLDADRERTRITRQRGALLKQLRDLEQLAERHKAIGVARAWLDARDADGSAGGGSAGGGAAERGEEEVAAMLHRIRARLITAPCITLEWRGTIGHYVLGEEITIGRTRSDILIASTAISRQHLRVFRRDGTPHVEDLDTRNGTLLAGARLAGAIPVGDGLALSLAGQVPCDIEPHAQGVQIDVAGQRHIAALGPLEIEGWRINDAHEGEDRFVCLSTAADRSPPFKGELGLRRRIELAVGDALSDSRAGPIVLSVPPQETLR